MEGLEAEANKVRRRTEDPDKLMEQLKLIQKKQQQLMEQQRLLQVRFPFQFEESLLHISN